MKRPRVLALIGLTMIGLIAPVAAVPAVAAAPQTSTLVAIRAAHHPGYDRLVFEFRGPVPSRQVGYVKEVLGDFSGLPVPVVGNAKLRVSLRPAVGHTEAGVGTYGPVKRTYALPNIIQVVNSGDFEGVVSFGVGLARRTPFTVFTLTRPSRVVIDIRTPFRTVPVRDYFLNSKNFAVGKEPYVKAVWRPVIPPAVATGALQRLFAGPTQGELAAGLRFVSSGATGFTDLSIRDRVARVRLTGGCNSGGSTFTIAGEIMPTLKQFSTVRWVKIYDPSGRTERPYGHSDSIPFCLEP